MNDKAADHFRAFTRGGMPAHHLVCPLDKRARAARPDAMTNTNLSYFLSLNAPKARGTWILSGNRNLFFVAESNSMRHAAWRAETGLHGDTGYLLMLDGSVIRVGDEELNKCFHEAGNITNRLAIP